MADDAAGSVIVKKNCVQLLQNNKELSLLFPVKFIIREIQDGAPEGYLYVDVFKNLNSVTEQLQSDFLEKLQVC